MEVLQFLGAVFAAHWLGILLLVVGIALIGVEIFMPGFGVFGISGIVLTVIGIILTTDSFLAALVLILVILAILGILIALAIRSARKGKISQSPLILKDELDKESGYSSTKDMEFFIGREGTALTDLRPAGMCDFDGVKLDVVSEGDFIKRDSQVKIINVEGRRIVVKKI